MLDNPSSVYSCPKLLAKSDSGPLGVQCRRRTRRFEPCLGSRSFTLRPLPRLTQPPVRCPHCGSIRSPQARQVPVQQLASSAFSCPNIHFHPSFSHLSKPLHSASRFSDTVISCRNRVTCDTRSPAATGLFGSSAVNCWAAGRTAATSTCLVSLSVTKVTSHPGSTPATAEVPERPMKTWPHDRSEVRPK